MRTKNSMSCFLLRSMVVCGWAFLVSLLLLLSLQPALALSPDLDLELTPDEIRWLNDNRDSIRYAPNPSWPPGDFVEDGVHKGIVADYIRIFEEKLGVTFQRVFLKKWSGILTGLKNAETDFVGAIQKTEERGEYLDFTEPFLTTRLAVIVRTDATTDLSGDNLNSLTLACVEGYASTTNVRKTYPDAKIIESKGDLDALLRVSAGAADGAVVDFMVASYLVEKYGITNLRFGRELDFRWDLRFAIRKGMPELRSILDKTLGTISDEQQRKIYRSWIGIQLEHPSFFVRYQMVILGSLASIIALFSLAVVFAILLKRQVVARTKELTESGNQLQRSNDYLQAVLDSCGDAVFVHEADSGRIMDVNRRMCEMYGYTREEALQTTIENLSLGEPPYTQNVAQKWLLKARDIGPQTFDWQARQKDGRPFWVEISIRFAVIGGQDRFIIVVRDITARKKSLEEHEKLQAMLFQAQKMETVGQLAGGVAHDFNNMLAVILGYTELVMRKIAKDDPLQKDLEEVFDAAHRAADVTKQLLAFARKQTCTPQKLDLNESIKKTLNMLRRLIGEDIDLSWHPGLDRPFVFMDPSQLDQILTNLCVNARDAIDDSGEIVIEVGSVSFYEGECAQHVGFRPSEYIVLAVNDNGCGMDKETQQCIFEPFYTTKGIGEGTGLGLAMVYGIVKQNNGFINVYSEPDIGTTFKIYLPRHEGKLEQAATCAPPDIQTGQDETLLIVEDEAALLALSKQILQDQGYTVLVAQTPSLARNLAKEHIGQIHLLITDVVLPEMNGKELVMKLRALHPELKVLFMSGYPANMIIKRGVLEDSVNFMQKPFSSRELVAKVKEILNHPGVERR